MYPNVPRVPPTAGQAIEITARISVRLFLLHPPLGWVVPGRRMSCEPPISDPSPYLAAQPRAEGVGVRPVAVLDRHHR